MKFKLLREDLLKPLQLVSGAVEKRKTLAILANVLLSVHSNQLSISATDMEIELVGRVTLKEPAVTGVITVPAKKMLDICRSMPEQTVIDVVYDEPYVRIIAGRSRFNLMPKLADEFPTIELKESKTEFCISQNKLRFLLESAHFSMGQNDVRYYLNGLSLQVSPQEIRAVATDGHRLATAVIEGNGNENYSQVIIPRKGVIELLKFLSDTDEDVTVSLTDNTIRVTSTDFTYTSKLIDAKYPDYKRVIPRGGDKYIILDKEQLRGALTRVSILSNEKYRGVRFQLSENTLLMAANNPDQEEAEEALEIEYNQEPLSIGFNVSYVIDVLNNIAGDEVGLTFKDSDSSLLIGSVNDDRVLYVVMPMRL